MKYETEWPHELEWIVGTEPLAANDVLFPFALDEVLCRRMGRGGRSAVHVWRHPSALVLGLRDRKLPYAEAAMGELRAAGRSVAVRNSGGAAVPLDAGVVNVSLVLPLPERSRDFRDDFRYMADLVAGAAERWSDGVSTGEIAGAYCPGDFDLSIGGRKFCGISQRRQSKAFAVQAFVNVEGGGEERGRTAAVFYERASGGDDAATYPRVTAGRTTSIAEAVRSPVTAGEFAAAVRGYLEGRGVRIIEVPAEALELDEVWDTVRQLRQRYDT